jgi:hypothetical protein
MAVATTKHVPSPYHAYIPARAFVTSPITCGLSLTRELPLIKCQLTQQLSPFIALCYVDREVKQQVRQVMAEVLGAVGSVVGIAGFSLQLAHYLDKYRGAYKSAPSVLATILERIDEIYEVLGNIKELLELERENITSIGKAQLFSPEVLRQIRANSDKCLKIFWRIEAIILQGNLTEGQLADKLNKFHDQLRQPEGAVLLQLDRGMKLDRIDKLKWSFNINSKLKEFDVQLDRRCFFFTLILQVITLRVNMLKA